MSSSSPQWQSAVQASLCFLEQSAVQASLCFLEEHRVVHFTEDRLLAPQAHFTSCSAVINLPSSSFQPRMSGSGITGYRMMSWEQMFAYRWARRMRSTHAPGVSESLSTHSLVRFQLLEQKPRQIFGLWDCHSLWAEELTQKWFTATSDLCWWFIAKTQVDKGRNHTGSCSDEGIEACHLVFPSDVPCGVTSC